MDNRKRYRQLFTNTLSPSVLYTACNNGLDFIITDINKAALELEKVAAAEVIGKRVTEVFPGVSAFGLLQVFRDVWKSGVPQQKALSFYMDKRISGWRENYVYRIPTGEIVAVYNEITDQKSMLASFHKSKEMAELIMNSMSESIWLLDLDFNMIYVSPSACKNRQYTIEEVLSLPLEKQLTKDSYCRARIFMKEILQSHCTNNVDKKKNDSIELEVYKKDGSTYISEIKASLVCDSENRPTGVLGIGRDITDRKQMEAALRESEERYKRISETLIDYIYTVRFDKGKAVETTHGIGCEMVTGYNNDDFKNNRTLWISMVHPDDQQRVREFFSYIIEKPLVNPIEHRIIRKDGLERWVRNTPVFHFSEQGILEAYDGIVQDITERKQAEQALFESEKRYRTLFNGINDGIVLADMEKNGATGQVLEVNNVFCNMLGYSRSELLTMRVPDFSENQIDQNVDQFYQKRLTEGHATFERTLITKNGSKIPVEINSHLIFMENMLCVLSILRDISERKKIDAEILKTQHLESLSLLAGGIAHDFNNLLGGIFGYIDIAKEFAPTPEKAGLYLEKALKSLDRAKDLSQRLLTFSKGGIPEKKLANLETVLKDATTLALSGSNVKVTFSIAKNLMPCEIDVPQIGRVINNIVLNATQAMKDGGLLYVKAKNILCSASDKDSGKTVACVEIRIKDTGCGIPQEMMEKIFNPFFTTKKHGTGLGLPICESIIKKHDGSISAKSVEGKGTEFVIVLPGSKNAKVVADESIPTPQKGHGRILIMDDEDYILELTQEMLVNLGYSVETAQHGEDAVKVYTKAIKTGKPFCAVLLDLTVPGGMGGLKTIEKIRAINPKVLAIAASGYSNDPVFAEPQKFGFAGTIKKPFISRELSVVLGRVLKL